MKRILVNLFGFGGSLARSGFALCMAFWLAAWLAIIASLEHFFGIALSEETSRLFDEPVLELLFHLSVFWNVMSLSAARIRDMGFSPWLPVAVLIAIEILENWVLPHMTEARLPSPLESFTPLGGILSIGSLLWLLFWPSRRQQPADAD